MPSSFPSADPENGNHLEQLGVTMDVAAKGPICDDSLMTDVEECLPVGMHMHINDPG